MLEFALVASQIGMVVLLLVLALRWWNDSESEYDIYERDHPIFYDDEEKDDRQKDFK